MTTREHALYCRAIDLWGKSAQFCQAMEECGELISALNKHLRHGNNRANLVDEMVDVTIMIEQVRMMIGCTDDDFEEAKRLKLIEFNDAVTLLEGKG